MCGIVGYLSSREPIEVGALTAMRDAVTHRGPDGAGLWRSDDGRVGLAHRRLAIVDLSPGGAQPMASPDGRYQLVFNGEVYNHRALRDELAALGWSFRGSSDTEVLLAAYAQWGERALSRLSGMFAFAVYDTRDEALFVARDRAGEKPLFYRHAGGVFAFASELKSLLAHPAMPRRADPAALDHYLAYGYVPRGLCALEGYAKLPAARWLRYELRADRVTTGAYWELPRWAGGRERSWGSLLDELDPLFEASVRRQLVADVPVGVLLSGGLDSSLVAATAARVSSRVKTFTIGFPGSAMDESPLARRLARELGTEHVELMAEANSAEHLPALAAQFDEPIADSSMVPTYMVSRLVRARATVALGGDGGDELFGGYKQYAWVHRLALAHRAGLYRLPLMPLASRLPETLPGRRMALRMVDRSDPVVTLPRLIDPRGRRALLHRAAEPSPEAFRAGLVSERADARERAMAHDFLTYMVDDVLVKVDRASMLASLEVRAPLLDHAVVEFAFSQLSPRQRAGEGERKRLLRRLAKRRLPAWFDVTRKQGFSIPLAEWLRGPWAPLLEDMAARADGGLLDAGEVRRFVREAKTSPRNATEMFQLLMLELWRDRYGVTLG